MGGFTNSFLFFCIFCIFSEAGGEATVLDRWEDMGEFARKQNSEKGGEASMVVSIEEIAPLGGSLGEYSEPTCWFCIFDYRCYDGETLRNMGVGQEERTPENGYIPLFRTNMRTVAKDFLRSQSPKEYEPIFEEYEDFDRAFNIFLYRCSLYKKWILYRDRRLKRDAVRWCKENHLPWKSTDILLYPFEY